MLHSTPYRRCVFTFLLSLFLVIPNGASASAVSDSLIPQTYFPLPLGTIRAEGWLEETLRRMATGMTGQLDSLYVEVLGPRNGWLGGDGDGWERGPYWIDGLLPLAYLLDDEHLKVKAGRWVEWTLANQGADGYLGPVPFTENPGYEPGLQRTQRRDWWPKMVMLKVLQQYYGATGDERVLTALHRYFRYQLKELPTRPLDTDTFWANRRGADNLLVVQWLYDLSREPYLMDLAHLLEEQTFPWDEVFVNAKPNNPEGPWSYGTTGRYPFKAEDIAKVSLADQGNIHCVNLAQGLKQPSLLYRQSGDSRYLDALQQALTDIKRYHGQVQGMFGGDEPLHGRDPTRGVEFCAVSETMFSLETIQHVTGNVRVADLLERITYNALPTQANDDFTARQYFQAANQIALRRHVGNSFENNNHRGTDFVFGERTGYPCCTTNMHQSWPKFTQNLFYATPDGGVAALQYAPATVTLKVADDVNLSVQETTGYPFREEVVFTLDLSKSATFPFHLRIPGWTKRATILVNGQEVQTPPAGAIAIVNRLWKNGDQLSLRLPMELKVSTWFDYTKALERGPLVYALGVDSRTEARTDSMYGPYLEVSAAEPWNYGLILNDLKDLTKNVQIETRPWDGNYPWNATSAPVRLKLKGLRIPEWTADDGIPHLPSFWGNYSGYTPDQIENITLIPYGCTMLRIAEFPAYQLSGR